MSRGGPSMIQGKRQFEEGKARQDNYEKNLKAWRGEYLDRTAANKETIGDYADIALNRYEHLAQQGLPEQQRQNYLRDTDRLGQNQLAQVSSRRGGLSQIGRIDQAQRDSMADLLEMDAMTRLQNQYRLAEVAPQFESAADMYEMQRMDFLDDLTLGNIYEERDYGRWLQEEGFRKHQEGWAQLDEDIMSWMTMGMGGGGSPMGGGGQQSQPASQPTQYQSSRTYRSTPRYNEGSSFNTGGVRSQGGSFSTSGYGQQNQSFGGYGGDNTTWISGSRQGGYLSK